MWALPIWQYVEQQIRIYLQKKIVGIMVGTKLQIHVEVYLWDLRFHLFHGTIYFHWWNNQENFRSLFTTDLSPPIVFIWKCNTLYMLKGK